jgi:phosphate transport system substrate-binding protein
MTMKNPMGMGDYRVYCVRGGCKPSSRVGSNPLTTVQTATQSTLSGTIRIDGSSTVLPISEAVAEEFAKQYPNVQPTVGKSGTGGGFKKFANGEIDITGASRPIREEEDALCKKKRHWTTSRSPLLTTQ